MKIMANDCRAVDQCQFKERQQDKMQHFQLKGNFKTCYKFLAETNVVIHESDAL